MPILRAARQYYAIMQQNLYLNQRLPLTLLAIGIVVFVAYLPGLRGPFVFDDTYHILSNPAVALESLFLAVDPVAKRLIPVEGFVG